MLRHLGEAIYWSLRYRYLGWKNDRAIARHIAALDKAILFHQRLVDADNAARGIDNSE